MSANPVAAGRAKLHLNYLENAKFGREGSDPNMERRRLLKYLLSTSAVTLTPQLFSEASAVPSSLEEGATIVDSLGKTVDRIHEIGRLHMNVASQSYDLKAQTLAVWRDAAAISDQRIPELRSQARWAETRAAAMLASFYGDEGNLSNSTKWYRLALQAKDEGDTEGYAWVMAYHAWAPLFSGNYMKAIQSCNKALSVHRSGAAGALLYAQLARARAAERHYQLADRALIEAESELDLAENLHGVAPQSLLGFSRSQFSAYAFETYAVAGNTDMARQHQEGMSDDLNPMNHALKNFNESLCMLREGSFDAAGSLALDVLRQAEKSGTKNAVVMGKARYLDVVFQRSSVAKSIKEVREFSEMVRAA